MKVIITGGSGNLARYCVDELLVYGHEVVLFDRVAPADAADPWTPATDHVIGDLTSLADCQEACEMTSPEAVIHLGGISYATDEPASRREAAEAGLVPLPDDATFRVNTLGTYNMLRAAVGAGARRFIFASSVVVYPEEFTQGHEITTLPIEPDVYPARPNDSYSMSKWLGEQMLEQFHELHGLTTCALRMDWVYMPHVPTGFESANPILDWETATLNRRGLVGYQYLDARDAASAYRLAIESEDLARPETIYVATDRTTRSELRELLRGAGRFTDVAERMEPDDLFLSIAHAQRVLGYRPRHSWLGSRDRAA